MIVFHANEVKIILKRINMNTKISKKISVKCNTCRSTSVAFFLFKINFISFNLINIYTEDNLYSFTC